MTHVDLQQKYQNLPWYKKLVLWLSAPKLAWYLFGYNQKPDRDRVHQFTSWAKASWFFQSICETHSDEKDQREDSLASKSPIVVAARATSSSSGGMGSAISDNDAITQSASPITHHLWRSDDIVTAHPHHQPERSEGSPQKETKMSNKSSTVMAASATSTSSGKVQSAISTVKNKKALPCTPTSVITLLFDNNNGVYNIVREVTTGGIIETKQLNTFFLLLPKKYNQTVGEVRFNQLLQRFLLCVAQGNQKKAEMLLKIAQQKIEIIDNKETSRRIEKGKDTTSIYLLGKGDVKDYAGRLFKNISAYEYAYWAKDSRMCRMLAKYMDAQTKATMKKWINLLKSVDEETVSATSATGSTGQPRGLVYEQNGKEHRSPHFDMTSLIMAQEEYIKLRNKKNWLDIGRKQRDLPVHVIHEYCNMSPIFNPCPISNEDRFERYTNFYDFNRRDCESLFPLRVTSHSDGLGYSFTLTRSETERVSFRIDNWAIGIDTGPDNIDVDLNAIKRLDELRTKELEQLLIDLDPRQPSSNPGLSPH